jgi:uncharacterized membrane protein YuzA (DUF378 family)
MDAIQWLQLRRKFDFLAYILIIVGALNWGFIGVFGINLVTELSKYTTPMIQTVVYSLVGLAGLYLLFRRDYYLPFLGETVFPCDPLTEKTPEKADTAVEVYVRPNANVIFWAADDMTSVKSKEEESKKSTTEEDIENPWKAYMRFNNSGVVRADSKGRATLRVRRPVTYRVPMAGRLDRHVHYRVCGDNGMLGTVQTVKI